MGDSWDRSWSATLRTLRPLWTGRNKAVFRTLANQLLWKPRLFEALMRDPSPCAAAAEPSGRVGWRADIEHLNLNGIDCEIPRDLRNREPRVKERPK
jgi:hypothetical protein